MSRPDSDRVFLGGRATLVRMPGYDDHRGRLVPYEMARFFEPKRAFVVNGVPDGTRRGGHAHRKDRQLMICLAGRVAVELRYRGEDVLVHLDRSSEALLVEPGVWCRQTYHGGAQLLVFASEPYDPGDYIRDEG